MPRILLLLLGLLAALVLTPLLGAGDLDPAFARKLARGDAEAFYPAVVVLRDRVDLAALDRRLDRGRAPRALRHRRVIEALQRKALATQGPVLAAFRGLAAGARSATCGPCGS